MQRIYTFYIVTSQLYCNEWCNIKRRRFTDTKLHQRACCEEFGLTFHIGQMYVDVKCKQIEPHFDDIKYASIKISGLEGKLQNMNG